MPLGTSQVTVTTANVFRPNVWSQEALRARESNLVLVPLVKHYDREIASKGQTVEIPNVSNLTANLKVANTQVTLNSPTETKTTVTINQHYECSVLIEDIVDAQSAYDLAQEYTAKVGYALAEKMDYFVATKLNAGGTYTIGQYGAVLNDQVILAANRYLDDAKAPPTDRALVVTPQGKQEMLNIDKYIRYDAIGKSGTDNSIANGQIGEIYGVRVYMSQNLVVTAATPTQNNHLFFHKEALAMAVQKDVKFASQRKEEYLGTLYVGQALWGGSILRADHIVTIKS
jgi:N4-gp56 family major capsid protein